MESWKKRLSSALRDAADRSAVFVLGDGLARDSTGGFGGSGRVLEVLAQDYGIREPVAGEDVSEAKVYGRRLERLQADEGQAEVARLFRKVVLAACQLPEHDPRRHAALEPPHHLRGCAQLMEHPADWWYLPQRGWWRWPSSSKTGHETAGKGMLAHGADGSGR